MRLRKNIALCSSLIFLFVGTTWILLSDALLEWVTIRAHLSLYTLTTVQNAKGFIFVAATALLLYLTIKRGTDKLEDSKREYRNLFRHNPAPMFIYDVSDGSFLAINDASCKQYGYTYEELKTLNIRHIRLANATFLNPSIYENGIAGLVDIGLHLHRKKHGTEFWIHKYAKNIIFDNKPARLILAFDVTEEVIAKERLLRKNKQLEEIAWFESHQLRAPIARMIGLLNIIDLEKSAKDNEIILTHLKNTSEELDLMVRHLSYKTIHDRDEPTRVA